MIKYSKYLKKDTNFHTFTQETYKFISPGGDNAGGGGDTLRDVLVPHPHHKHAQGVRHPPYLQPPGRRLPHSGQKLHHGRRSTQLFQQVPFSD